MNPLPTTIQHFKDKENEIFVEMYLPSEHNSLIHAKSNPCVCLMGVYQVVDASQRISDVPEWFKGARLNYAENLLKHADQDKVALYAASK